MERMSALYVRILIDSDRRFSVLWTLVKSDLGIVILYYLEQMLAKSENQRHRVAEMQKIRLDVVTCAKPRGGNCLLLPHTGYASECDGITYFYVTESHNVKLSSSYEQSNKLISLNIEYPLLYGIRGSLI